jgi:uncharacterized membrane protein YwzB
MKKYVTIVLLIVLAAIAFWGNLQAIPLNRFQSADVLQIIMTLFVIALFLERAMDVFLTTWRAPQSEQLSMEIKYLQENLKPNPNDKEFLRQKREKETALAQFKRTTRTISMWTGFILGMIVALAGIRALFPLVDARAFRGIPALQQSLFRLLDVLITGGLLAGGSDGIHKLAEVYRAFMESTKIKASL